VHSRILLGVAAWLVGATAATVGSLLAVSVLGQGMNPAGEQVSVETVNRALAKEGAERSAAMPRRSASPSPSRTAPPSPKARHSTGAAPSTGTGGGAVLTSRGGTLVASCAGARAYLVSWSPDQGFGTNGVVRGPAVRAQVTFTGAQLTVTMVVTCAAGAPTAITTAVSATAANSWGGDGE